MIRVIINADDLGKSAQVNDAIGQAMANGLISSSTILANSDSWDEIHRIVDNNPQGSFGIHLNLTEGKALTYSRILFESGVVDEYNKFRKNVHKLPVYTPEILRAIKEEWRAQIKKVIEDEGIEITHIDGHHHIHTFYPFRKILSDLLKEFGITKARNRYNYPRSKFSAFTHSAIEVLFGEKSTFKLLNTIKDCNSKIAGLYGIIENRYWRKEIGFQVTMTPYFDSYEHFCMNANYLDKNIDTTVELMCHPGHSLYEKEFDMIRQNRLGKITSFKLISYKAL